MRRLNVRTGLALLFVIAAAGPAVAQNTLGQITSTLGYVEIDAFGVGDFVVVQAPEYVYEDSVIRTDYESWAYLTIDGQEFTVSPNSVTPVSSFVTDRRRNKGTGFFSRILRELTRSLSPPEEEEIVAGGRASEVADAGTAWVFDIDPDELFEEALRAIEDGDFEYAVDSLRLIEYPADGTFDIEEYYVNLAYSLMGLGDFHAAMVASFEYALLQPLAVNVQMLPPRLQLLGGIAAYYAGEDTVADAALEQYLINVPMESVAPEAVVTRWEQLSQSGRGQEAAGLLADARAFQPDVDWDELTRP